MKKITSSLECYLSALYFDQVGPIKIKRWLNHFGSIQMLFDADDGALQQAGLTEKEINNFKQINFKQIEKDIEWCTKHNCHIITLDDILYPALLKEISDPPIILFVKGDVNLLSKQQIAMVGTRNPSSHGRETATHLAAALSQSGLIITSGLALGIDSAAHRGALKVVSPTIAVTGSGLNHIYPKSNLKLANEIESNGAIISEFPPEQEPIAKNFPRRNRIISGLSLGVVVVEAAIKSGSLITARFSMEQGREVFAIPGSIYNPMARGCHSLIQDGAKLVETANDVLEELGSFRKISEQTKEPPINSITAPNDQIKNPILPYIDYVMTPLNTIVLRSGLTAGEVSSMLLSLELEGLVEVVPGGYLRQI